MKRLAILVGAICWLGFQIGWAQQKTVPNRSNKSSAAAVRDGAPSPKQSPGTPDSQGKTTDMFGPDAKDRPKGPTDIRCSQEAQFDSKTRSGVFIGNVKVVDPQFTLTTDRLSVRLNKEQDGGGLEEALAEGNVIIVHVNQPKSGVDQTQGPAAASPVAQPGAQTQQSVTSTGKAEKALYEAKDGSITLTGWPQVTQGVNTQVATAPGVKMILYKDGRMQTYGSTRTLIQDRTATNKPNANGAQ